MFEPDQAEDSDLMDQDDEDEGDKGSVREEEEEEEEDVYREEGRSRKVSQFLFYRYIFTGLGIRSFALCSRAICSRSLFCHVLACQKEQT